MAQYYIDKREIQKAEEILNWIKQYQLKTGMMGEQIDPTTNEIISPAPLTWSHAEYVTTLLNFIKLRK